MYVIGTAGHVDHGKSLLVEALTGIDPDRLREEKERGMTIDLGFAWLRLPGGLEVSVVDVPGHERFVRNMLAGAGGIDLALLVIAADEGVMPQTREHLAILDLLEVKHGIVVLTKKDLVDDEWLELVQTDVMTALEGTALEDAPFVACSALTGEGLPDLLNAIESELKKVPPRPDLGRPRLPIDRVFTIAGFGTVVTGTLIDGSLSVGQEVEVLPGDLRSRIRGLQTHRRKLDRAEPGSRVAANLAGTSPDDLRRGMVVTAPGWLTPTTSVDVRLRAVKYLHRPVRHNLEISFHSGSGEVAGRLRLLDQNELRPGESGWAQIRLEEPMAVAKGDYFVVRTPNDTIGGGRIVEVHAPRHRRFHEPTLRALVTLSEGSPEDTLYTVLARMNLRELSAIAAAAGLSSDQAQASAQRLTEEGRVIPVSGLPLTPETILSTADGLSSLLEKTRQVLQAYHAEFPLREGMTKEELRSRLGLAGRPFAEALRLWVSQGSLSERGNSVALPEHRPSLAPAQQAAVDAFLQALTASPYSPPTENLPGPEILAYLAAQGHVVRVGQSVVFATAAYKTMVERVTTHLREHGTITLAQVRDMFGTSRKYAQALLEHLDEQHITRRVGDERVLRER